MRATERIRRTGGILLLVVVGFVSPGPDAVAVASISTRASSDASSSSRIFFSGCPGTIVDRRCIVGTEEESTTEVFSMMPDGSSRDRLTQNEGFEQALVWSPNRERIAFSVGSESHSCEYDMNLRVMTFDGGAPTTVTPEGSYRCDLATDWGKGGLLFERRCSLCSDIYVVRPGSPERALTTIGRRDGPDTYAFNGRWLNPREVVFDLHNYPDAKQDVYVVDTDGRRRRLTESPRLFEGSVAVSPDRTWIAYSGVKRAGGRVDVFVMKADGSERRRLTDDVLQETQLEWSPDGKRLVFLGHSSTGEYHAYVVGRDGSGHRRVTAPALRKNSNREFDAHWSPDGRRIVLAGEAGGASRYAVFVVNLRAETARRLTPFEPRLRVWGWHPPP